ncbi:MAG: sigma-54-dependent Fis family transcriptional regulator [bacterium]|nr:MAG: sigma-54-dependent Fis family transcriptional regulator [bacterium]
MNNLHKRALDAVYRVSQCLGKPGEPDETILEILGILDSVAGYKNGMVTMIDPDSGDLLVEAAHGMKPERWKNVRYRKGEGISGRILESGGSLAIPLVKNDPRFLHRIGINDPDSAFIGVPIQVGDKPLGVLSVTLDPAERHHLDDHKKIVAMFANLVGGVISRLLKVEKEKEVIIREKDRLKGELKTKFRPENMIGVSKLMEEIFENIEQVARWNTPVMIRGESGTGKELVAKAIHYRSPRSFGPFVKLNCASLPDTLIESELFGHEKGAFTGAVRKRQGRFELAHKGTLFLDEIGDTTPAFQSKILRVLQEGQYERLGGEETLSVDVRLITATNINLEKAVAQKNFREDLYYRMNVMPMFLPPLRERTEDIPHLVEHFLRIFGKECGDELSIDREVLLTLENCDWPGNIRELENCVHRAAVTCKNFVITKDNIPCTKSQCFSRLIHAQAETIRKETKAADDELFKIENERERVIAALEQSGWVQAKAARLLKMSPRQIGYRIKKLNIEMKNL